MKTSLVILLVAFFLSGCVSFGTWTVKTVDKLIQSGCDVESVHTIETRHLQEFEATCK